MRKSFAILAFVAATAGFSGFANAQYTAIAAGPNGIACADGRSMESARDNAVAQCRRMGGSCSISTSERSHWNFVGGYCDGEPYTAASEDGESAAYTFLRRKAGVDGRSVCTLVKSC